MLDLAQVRTLLLAERSRDVAVIAEAVDRIGDERGSEPARYRNGVPRCRLAHLFDRQARAYHCDRHAGLAQRARSARMSPQENRYALAGTTGHS